MSKSGLQLMAKRKRILLAGESGTGKTTFALRYLVAESKLSCRFVFDPEGEFEERLNITAASTQEECELATEDGFVLFDPHAMFEGELEKAFEWFCQWSFDAASRMRGEKVLLVDEAWMYCAPNTLPKSLARCIQTGRKRGLATMFATQRPNRLNEAITNGVTELVCFRLQGGNALQTIEKLNVPRPVVEEISKLPDGAFVSLNLARGGDPVRGRLF